MDRDMTLQEMKEVMDRYAAEGNGVEFLSLPGIGIVSARPVTPEEMAKRRTEDSKTHYPCFRPKWMGPPRNWQKNE
jgi:hypothetical protein